MAFIGRPNIPREMWAQALARDAGRPDPLVSAIQAISSLVREGGEAFVKHKEKKADMAFKKDMAERLSSFQREQAASKAAAHLTETLAKQDRLTPYNPPAPNLFQQPKVGFQGFDFGLPAAGQSRETDVPQDLLSGLLANLGYRVPKGAQDYRVGEPPGKPPKPKAPGVVPLTQNLVDRIKKSPLKLDLTEFMEMGTDVPLSLINSMLGEGKKWEMLLARGGGSDPKTRNRQLAARLAFQQATKAASDITLDDETRQALMDNWGTDADEIYQYLEAQKAQEEKPSLAESFMKAIIDEAQK